MTIITAPDYKEVEGPLIFLAGPIQGAEDWQRIAIELITREKTNLNIASPRGDYSNRKFDYNTQVDWETHYLNQAARSGEIFFWLAKEKEHMCDRAFAQTTRFELAEWLTKYRHVGKLGLSIGIEAGFSGERYLRRRIEQDYPEIQIYSTLEDICTSVVWKSQGKNTLQETTDALLCPVCNGRGTVPSYFYCSDVSASTTAPEEMCRTCVGIGTIHYKTRIQNERN